MGVLGFRECCCFNKGVPVAPPGNKTIVCMTLLRRVVNHRGGRCGCKGRHR